MCLATNLRAQQIVSFVRYASLSLVLFFTFAASIFVSPAEAQTQVTTGVSAQNDIAVLTNGDHVEVWDAKVNGHYGIFARINNNSTVIQVNQAIQGDQRYPRIAALDNGRWVVSWTELQSANDTKSGANIRFSVFNSSGAPVVQDQAVNAQTVADYYHGFDETFDYLVSNVAALPGGRFVIAYSAESVQSEAGHHGVHAEVWTVKNQSVVFVDEDMVGNMGSSPWRHLRPALAAVNGGFVVGWTVRSGNWPVKAGEGSAVFERYQVTSSSISRLNGGPYPLPKVAKNGTEFTGDGTTKHGTVAPSFSSWRDGFAAVYLVGSNVGVTNNTGKKLAKYDVRVDFYRDNKILSGSPNYHWFPAAGILGELWENTPDIATLAGSSVIVTWHNLKNADDYVANNPNGMSSHWAFVNPQNGPTGIPSVRNIGANTSNTFTPKGRATNPRVASFPDCGFMLLWTDSALTGSNPIGIGDLYIQKHGRDKCADEEAAGDPPADSGQYLAIYKDVIDLTAPAAGGTLFPPTYTQTGFPIILNCSLNPGKFPVPIKPGFFSTNDSKLTTADPAHSMSGANPTFNGQPSVVGNVCTVTEDALPDVQSRVCPTETAVWTTNYSPPNGQVTIEAGKTAVVRVINTLQCEPNTPAPVTPAAVRVRLYKPGEVAPGDDFAAHLNSGELIRINGAEGRETPNLESALDSTKTEHD